MKKGWEYKKFGEVCWYNKNNGLHKRTRYVGMEHIEQGTGRLLCTISSDDVLSNTFAFNKGDVLYGRLRPYLKKVIVADFDGCCSTELFPIQSKDIIAPFLKYWFLTDEITNKINATCAGCRMPRGNMNDVLKFDISYPPLSEQQSIVDYLDSAFAKIDAMKANAEKALNEAKALFQASLKEMLEPKEGWEEKKLCEVVNIINGYAFPSKAFGDNQELKVVKITNVGVGSFIEDISTLPQKMFIQDVCLKEGDIVIALTRTIISNGLKRAIIPSSYDGAMLNQRVASLRYCGNINMSFLYYYLGCSTVSDYVWLHVNTLMQPNLSIKDLKNLPVCNPPLSEQQSITATLDTLKSKVDRLQENYEKISQECDALKQAILRQVFE